MSPAIIFDFDGTLIDSRPAILDAFDKALGGRKLQPRIALSAVRIGPPLGDTLRELVGGEDEALLAALAEDFKAHYDSTGYRATTVFAGIPAMLAALMADGTACYLATNKRLLPTRLILAHLQWEQYFRGVYTLDRQKPNLPNKASMLARLLVEEALDPEQTIYVGDTPEDKTAALASGLHFVGVTWGYGDFGAASKSCVATVPALLVSLRRQAGRATGD